MSKPGSRWKNLSDGMWWLCVFASLGAAFMWFWTLYAHWFITEGPEWPAYVFGILVSAFFTAVAYYLWTDSW